MKNLNPRNIIPTLIALTILTFSQTAPAVLPYTITDLGTLPGGTWSQARGINNYGQVVGEAIGADGYRYGFFWEDGVIENLGTFGGMQSDAFDINDDGQIVCEGLPFLPRGWIPT